MSGELKLMKMPSCLKKKLKDGMIKEFRNENLTLVIKFFCTSLVSDILQANFFPNGKALISSKKFTVLELSR